MNDNSFNCIRCGKLAVVAGVYRPDDQAAHGAPEGQERLYLYGLCSNCFSAEHHRDEAAIFIEAEALSMARRIQAGWIDEEVGNVPSEDTTPAMVMDEQPHRPGQQS